MVRIAICDDKKAEQDYLQSLLNLWTTENNIKIEVDIYSNAEELLFNFSDKENYDIFLLDIEMGDMNGIELAKTIRKTDEVSQIVSITGYPDFVMEGYEVAALHYIIKPVSLEKFFQVMEKACNKVDIAQDFLVVNTDNLTLKIPFPKIIYIEAKDGVCFVTTTDNIYELSYHFKLSALEKSLDNGFIKCHRSYIVGVRHITSFTKTDILLDNGASIPIARRQISEVHRAFINYFTKPDKD